MSTDNMISMSKVLKQKKDYTKLRETIELQRNEIVEKMSEDFNIDQALDCFTTEEIENMSFSKMKEVFVNHEGNFIFNEQEISQNMSMDFIKYLKHSRETFKKMDEELEKLDQTLEEFNKEIKAITKETSFNKTLKASIENDLASEDISEEKRDRCNKFLAAMEDATTLRPLFELYEKISVKNTIVELNDKSKKSAVLNGYVRVCKELDITPKLLKFGEFEKRYLNEKYHVHNDLFIFIVARYIKYLGKAAKEPQNLVFITQLTNYITEIILGEENSHYQADIEEIAVLKTSIERLLDKFYN